MEAWFPESQRGEELVTTDPNIPYSHLSGVSSVSNSQDFPGNCSTSSCSEPQSVTNATNMNGYSASKSEANPMASTSSKETTSKFHGSLSSDDDEPLSSLNTSSDSVGPWHHLEALLINSGIPSDLINYHLNEGNIELIQTFLDYISAPALRSRLKQYSTFSDAIALIKKSSNILVLTGAGLSVSCGIPDFRSENGVYARLKVEYPELPDPQAMFDMKFFETEPRPFFRFAKEIFPGNYEPSLSHKFISYLEQKNKLLRNYTQNIDTLEKSAGLTKVVYCHGSFAQATCQCCRKKVDCGVIKEDIFNQKIPRCNDCLPKFSECEDDSVSDPIFKPDIVFFGENLPEEFYTSLQSDLDKVDLLLVVGSSLKVRPVAAIPTEIPASIPQILINREPHHHQNFDIELLGDCDFIVQQIMSKLDPDWAELSQTPIETKYQDFCTLNAQSANKSVTSLSSDTAQNCNAETVQTCQTNIASSSNTSASSTSSQVELEDPTELTLFDEPPVKKAKILVSGNITENVYSFIPPNVTLFVNAKVFDNDIEKISMRLEDSEDEDQSEDEDSSDEVSADDDKPLIEISGPSLSDKQRLTVVGNGSTDSVDQEKEARSSKPMSKTDANELESKVEDSVHLESKAEDVLT